MDEQNSYCQARLRLPFGRLWQILGCTVRNLRRKAGREVLWFGHEVKVVDGSSCTLPDTASTKKPSHGIRCFRRRPGAIFVSSLRDFGLRCARWKDLR
jgi:hypothetical protein